MFRNSLALMRRSVLTRLWVAFVFLTISEHANAQSNPDQKFVRANGIKSALIQEPQYYTGTFLEYDTLGRLLTVTEFSWTGDDDDPGLSTIIQYDTSGRWISTRDYALSDSVQALRPEQNGRLMFATSTSYTGDSIEITCDTMWDEFQRITVIKRNEVHLSRSSLPPPPKMRSVYYSDKIVTSRLEIWSAERFTYHTPTTLNPDQIIKTGGVSMLEGRYVDGRVNYYMRSDSYSGDSVTQVIINSWYTLHGTLDTSFASYQCTLCIVDSSAGRHGVPLITYGYVDSKKRGNHYSVRFINPYFGKWQKLKSKKPWTDYRFVHYPVSSQWDTVGNESYQIENLIRRYHSKPKYTYWRNP